MRPISHDRALELVENLLHDLRNRNYRAVRFIQEREIGELLDHMGQIRVEMREMKEELERMKRNVGQLGSSDPD